MGTIKTIGIIGGGVAGLAAGGLLSKKGFRVKLFEANDKLGGCCATTNLNGYTFNDGALYLVFPGLLDHVFEKLGLDRPTLLPLRKIRANQRTTLPDGTVVCLGEGLDVTVQKSRRTLNRAQLERELQGMLRRWEPLTHLFAEDLLRHPLSLQRVVIKGWRHLPQLRGTVAGELNRLFSDRAVRAAMSGVLLFAGVPPHKMPVSSLLGLIALLTEGYYLPEGGMGKIPEALSQALKGNAGEIYLNARARQIVTKGGGVSGLEIEGQGPVKVDAVISTVSGMMTASMLHSKEVPPAMSRMVQRAPLSHKAFCLQLGLSNQIDACSHSNSVLPFMEEQDQIFRPDEDRIRYPIYSVPTVTMPGLAPSGGSIIEMYPSIDQQMSVDAWDEQAKEHIIRLGVESLSHLHRLDIAVSRVLSPKDLQDRLHLYRGAIYGLSPAAPLTAQFPHCTPISGLYQAGQTTWPGYGVSTSAVSGILAAETLLHHSLSGNG